MGDSHMGNQSSNWAAACIDDYGDECHYDDYRRGASEQQLVWEYQRYKPDIGWAAGENFETSDPGRYATYDESIFGETLQVIFFDTTSLKCCIDKCIHRVSHLQFQMAIKLMKDGLLLCSEEFLSKKMELV